MHRSPSRMQYGWRKRTSRRLPPQLQKAVPQRSSAKMPRPRCFPRLLFTISIFHRVESHARDHDARRHQPIPARVHANNSIHEYTNQAAVTETLGLAGAASARLASANAVRAQAELEIARRGLVSTVVELYYNIRAGADRLTVASVHSKKPIACRIDSKAGRRTRSGARRCHQGSPWTTTAPAGNG